MEVVAKRLWQQRGEIPSRAEIMHLADNLALQPLTARALLLRGIDTAEKGQEFLHAKLGALPDPDLLPDMAIACSRLEQALVRQEKIAVHGDYDVDGISGCALLVETLRNLGGLVEYHIPLRMKDGYGLSADAIRQARDSGCELIVSVDCGVTAHAEADLVSELGIDLIITDHHQPPEELPVCLALINPHLPGSRFPWQELSGVGVAFFLLAGLRRRLRENGYFNHHPEPDLRQGLDLVALGTIADIVPLGGVNRILVRAGLQLLEQGVRPGVRALKKVADVKQVSCGVVGFRLAPRLNAAGRLEDATLGVKLLLGDDPRQLQELADLLDGFNRERQQLEQQTLEQAIEKLEQQQTNGRHSIVLADEGWHSGVIGIVASRLVERYHRPTVMIAVEDGLGKGSCRSISGFHLFQALQDCAETLQGFGGHAMAAGLSIAAERLDDFAVVFEKTAKTTLSEDDLLPKIAHDGECRLAELNQQQVEELQTLNPFGAGNPQPTFISCGCQVVSPRVLGEKHLKFSVEQQGTRLDCIAFGMAERFEQLSGEVDLLFKPNINSWRGQDSVQLQIVDFRGADD
jgi:single-stranded-DNA-specific exonuclease